MDKDGNGEVTAQDVATAFGNGVVGEADVAAAKWWNDCYLMPEKCPHYPPSKAVGALIPWGKVATCIDN